VALPPSWTERTASDGLPGWPSRVRPSFEPDGLAIAFDDFRVDDLSNPDQPSG
jgi:hypothetical protein